MRKNRLYLHVTLDETAVLPSWFKLNQIYSKGTFKIPMEWRISNEKSSYAFKIPSLNTKGVDVGKDSHYRFYLKHILVTDVITDGAFLILLDLDLELLPDIKKQILQAEKRGEKIDYLTKYQPAYNILCPIWQ